MRSSLTDYWYLCSNVISMVLDRINDDNSCYKGYFRVTTRDRAYTCFSYVLVGFGFSDSWVFVSERYAVQSSFHVLILRYYVVAQSSILTSLPHVFASSPITITSCFYFAIIRFIASDDHVKDRTNRIVNVRNALEPLFIVASVVLR